MLATLLFCDILGAGDEICQLLRTSLINGASLFDERRITWATVLGVRKTPYFVDY